MARSSCEGVTVFECVLEGSRDDVNILCICRPCDEGLPGVGSRAVEHAAFCLRGREVSFIALFGVLHVWLEASLEARLVEAEGAKAELVGRLEEADVMEVSLELVQGWG